MPSIHIEYLPTHPFYSSAIISLFGKSGHEIYASVWRGFSTKNGFSHLQSVDWKSWISERDQRVGHVPDRQDSLTAKLNYYLMVRTALRA
jgi:hypothetical protein